MLKCLISRCILMPNHSADAGFAGVVVQAMLSYHVFAAATLQLRHELHTAAGAAAICALTYMSLQ